MTRGRDDGSPPNERRATAADALFALAVTRAESYLRRARAPERYDEAAILSALEPWLLRTRFASRIDARALARVLAARASHRGG